MAAADPVLSDPKPRTHVLGRMLFLMAVRTLFNTAHRMVYPFLPELSRFFGVTPAVFSSAIAFRSLAGITSPFLARFADTRGRRFGMLLGGLFFIAGLSLVVIWPRFEVFIAGLALSALGKYTLDPSIQAYLGDEVPVERRGEAVAIVELGWSLSYFIGVGGVRLLIERGGGLAPFQVLAFLGVAAFGGLFVLIPRDRRSQFTQAPFWPRVAGILSSPSTRWGLLAGFMLSAANELVSLTFALWLEQSFSMRLAALAAAALVIGASELLGESLVGILTDRLGSVRAVRAGALLNVLCAVLLPFVGRTSAGAYVGLFLFYLTFEFTVVSALSMMTELPTDSRATLMGLNLTSLSLGRMLAAWIALPLYAGGLPIVILGAVIFNLAGWAGVRGVRVERQARPVPMLDQH